MILNRSTNVKNRFPNVDGAQEAGLVCAGVQRPDSRRRARNKKHEMAELNIQPAASALKANVWKLFGFYDAEGKKDLDKSHTVCKLCRTKLKYLGNKTNMRNHMTRFHPEEERKQSVVVSSNQKTIEQAMSSFPPNSQRANRITNSVVTSIQTLDNETRNKVMESL